MARFIGATPGSSDLRSLLTDLCTELGVDSPPQDMNDLVRTFRGRLSVDEQGTDEPTEPPAPVVLFLDALDQLNPTDNARMLYWLPHTLAPGVKLVMSVLETAPSDQENRNNEDPYNLATRIWPDSLVELGLLDEESGNKLLDDWLGDAKRNLQPDQRADITNNFQANGSPLYLKLAFEEARHWRSWDGLPCGSNDKPGLNGDIPGILVDLFWRLERPERHGALLAQRALRSIAAAKNGLTEDELLDILSADSEVITDFLARSPESPQVDRLPVVIWSRLYADLQPYMTQRRADGTVVMDFYHRQVAEAVAARYLAAPDRLATHQHLADYFHGLDYWAESLEAQRARARRLPPTPRPANVRKVVELPYHRLEAAKLVDPDSSNPDAVYRGSDGQDVKVWDAVADLLTDWQFLEAKAEADPNFQEQESVEASSGGEAVGS